MEPDTTDDFPRGASYDRDTPAVVVHHLGVTDPAVVAESRRWSTGRRGPAVGEEGMAGVDLSGFVTQALVVGAHAIGTAGGVQDTFDLERLVTDVGARTTESTQQAVSSTTEVMNRATEAMQKAASDARKAIGETGTAARKSFADTVEGAKKTLLAEVHRLVGGDDPELAARLTPLLERFGRELDTRVTAQTRELLTAAAKQFDPADPTSPMSKHTRELHKQQETLSATLARQHTELTGKVDELATAWKVATSAKDAAATTARVTPIKGIGYEDEVHEIMTQVALGLGDEYTATGSTTGALSRSKKGDGVLTIGGGDARVVLEMTDSAQNRPWNDYLDEAERNRGAAASLGLVRDPAHNDNSTVRPLTARRIVLAFDPATDDPAWLRTVVQLLRLAALAASARQDREEIHTADEKITEALGLLGKIDDIRRIAGTLRQNAGKIEQQSDDVRAALTRLLTQAQSALSVAAEAPSDAA
ncbi:MAG: Fis family transcriptional regulator [Pseudonocardiaceae bacterium]|nr:Fis family transcriptional regulator [Pseudonocardiaceae bacterium]